MSEEKKETNSGRPPESPVPGAPAPIDKATGQHKDYWVLSAEDRAKGFVRPVRTQYRHVVSQPKYELKPLTPEQAEQYAGLDYTHYEKYPESESPQVGKFWKAAEIERFQKGCHAVTTMGIKIAETYARRPSFYSHTFCIECQAHLPVGADGDFVWIDKEGAKVGT